MMIITGLIDADVDDAQKKTGGDDDSDDLT
ncbi:hypothetical protein A2U01_0077321 [Trifolium medium]|uniref:Uncharacterized protein n=1 Tax=Trifolium medium TaxID=97028 RepID=A0A392T7E1_9FABA|nr:hypothetical protein [Trifolium medium]